MSKNSRAKLRAGKATAAAPRSTLGRGWMMGLAIAAGAVIAFFGWKSFKTSTESTQVQSTNSAASTAGEVRPEFQKLKGRWQRPDGGYVLEIKEADRSGNLDAGYFNPNPIHVAKAVALQENSVTKVFVELRDVNYPGSTYTLIYDPANDLLKGIYFQALQQQSFEVFFVRLK